jgi:hypothetical protein
LTRLLWAGAFTAGVLAATASPSWAQEAQAQPQAAQVTFPLDGGIVFWQIKPGATADFEFVVNKIKEALQKSENPSHKEMAAGWRVYKVQEPAPGGNVYYLFVIAPAVKDADYSSTALLKLLYDSFPAEAQDLYKKFTESSAGGRNVLNIQQIADMSK